MGAFSTLSVSRKAALAKVAERLLGHLSDEELEEMLDQRFRDRLRNFRIGHDDRDDEELERL